MPNGVIVSNGLATQKCVPTIQALKNLLKNSVMGICLKPDIMLVGGNTYKMVVRSQNRPRWT
jgi:carbamoylphosphate synthase small subunit